MPLTSRLRPLVAFANLVKEPALPNMSAPEVRRQLGIFGGTVGRFVRNPKDLAVSNRTLDLPGRRIAARVLRPKRPRGDGRIVVYFHGGGWVAGDLDSHDRVCRCLAQATSATVVSIDYRCAPEHRFPAAADDAFDATRWVVEHAAELGGTGERVFVAGDSAGGNLAAVTAIRARDAGIALRGQLLVYPVVAADFDTESYRANAEGYVLSRDRMRWFWDQYVPDAAMRRDPRVSPLDASLEGLPPALVITAEHDVLRSEGLRYAQSLADAGVSVETLDAQGMIHGYVSMPGLVPEADAALERIAAFVDRVG